MGFKRKVLEDLVFVKNMVTVSYTVPLCSSWVEREGTH